MIEIIEEQGRWNNLLITLNLADFYHTHTYHYLDKNTQDTPILIHYTEEEKTILLPLLVRKIQGTGYKDATSVYGYAGPITKNIDPHFDNTNFRIELENVLKEMNIISVFTRLNPFIKNQKTCFKNFGSVSSLGKVVYLDLTEKLEIQRQHYRKRLKTYINKAKKKCTVRVASTEEEVFQFMDIYHNTMKKLNAKEKYFFDKCYFQKLLSSPEFKSEILLAFENQSSEIVAGALFIKKGEIVHYHLSGTRPEFSHLNAIKLLIDTARISSTAENYKYLNLGGGVGSREDSLFHFKQSFSKKLKPFQIWTFVSNAKIYGELSKQNQKKTCTSNYTDCLDFFPCYRCNL
ncbi:peptidoglycan bridge formation glycyltransferase FemA/FemB family protein [Flagellimonas sp.]|uniref:peptidoglycan bridge formation glycyltransferase FemA/FemB family protein n=1 Tax=Flagellimonas sp. TaxID=2058762 RepID=UPI003B5CF965